MGRVLSEASARAEYRRRCPLGRKQTRCTCGRHPEKRIFLGRWARRGGEAGARGTRYWGKYRRRLTAGCPERRGQRRHSCAAADSDPLNCDPLSRADTAPHSSVPHNRQRRRAAPPVIYSACRLLPHSQNQCKCHATQHATWQCAAAQPTAVRAHLCSWLASPLGWSSRSLECRSCSWRSPQSRKERI